MLCVCACTLSISTGCPSPGLMNLWHACPKWHETFTPVQNFYLPCPISISVLWRIYVCMYVYIYIHIYIYISDCIESVYELPLLPNNTASETFLHKSRRDAKYWLDIYQWGTGLAVTGRIHNNGRKVLQPYFQTGRSSSPQLLPNILSYRIPRLGLHYKYNIYTMH